MTVIWESVKKDLRTPSGVMEIRYNHAGEYSFIEPFHKDVTESLQPYRFDKPAFNFWITANTKENIEARLKTDAGIEGTIMKMLVSRTPRDMADYSIEMASREFKPPAIYYDYEPKQPDAVVIDVLSGRTAMVRNDKKSQKPHFVIYTPRYKKDSISNLLLKHKPAHIKQKDLGYSDAIEEGFQETNISHMGDLNYDHYASLLSLTKDCLYENSANELAIDHGLEDDMLRIALQRDLKGVPEKLRRETSPVGVFVGALVYGSSVAPFTRMSKTEHAEKLRAALNQIFDSAGHMDHKEKSEMLDEVAETFSKSGNPPQFPAMRRVYDYVADKTLDMLRSKSHRN